ncbi:MAG: AbrB family transcriptional regulator [Verrucomicrobiota bacterium]
MKVSLRTGWLFLAAGALGFGLHTAHLPAAWLFGPLLASAFFAVRGWESFQLPKPVYLGAQAVIGTALGAGFSPSNLLILPRHPWVFVFAVVIILVLSLFNGWLLSRHTRLDVATAFLGTMPGGAGEMAAMSDSLGADTRLVVVMQYLRLLLILASLALVVPFLGHGPAHAAAALPTAASPAASQIGILALVSAAGWCAGMFTRIPAGTFLVPTLLYFGLDFLGAQPGTLAGVGLPRRLYRARAPDRRALPALDAGGGARHPAARDRHDAAAARRLRRAGGAALAPARPRRGERLPGRDAGRARFRGGHRQRGAGQHGDHPHHPLRAAHGRTARRTVAGARLRAGVR